MTGATGLVGSSLGEKLTDLGHSIVVVTRNSVKAREQLTFSADIIICDLNNIPLSPENFNGIDAIVNLVGESIDGRWSRKKKNEILNSRVSSSKNLLKNCPSSVKTIITASAQGIYGDRGNEELNEQSKEGEGFLSDVCRDWEAEFKNRQQRVVILRLGIVLTKKGGMLKKISALFQKNLGAILGTGNQWMSYISLNDLVNVFTNALTNEKYTGVINAANNNPVTNAVFTNALSKQLNVRQLPRVPSFVLKIVLGEMSHLVLDSTRVNPQRLNELGFHFNDNNLDKILTEELSLMRDHYSLFYSEQFVPFEIEKVFMFFGDHLNLEKITPDILHFRTDFISTPIIAKDTIIQYRLKIRGFPVKWTTLIKSWDCPDEFIDMQIKGPYNFWKHKHKFRKVKNGTLMIDEVQYKVPMGKLGKLVAGNFVENDVSQIFAHRREVIAKYNFDLHRVI